MNFKLSNPTRLYFGDQSLSYLSSELNNVKRLLLVYGGGSIKKEGIYDKVIDILKSETIEIFELSNVPANPTLDKVNEGTQLCINNNVDFILAVGGGSVIDCAKAIAVAAKYEGDIWDVIKHKKPANDKIPFGTILTNSATSSENNYYSVISKTDTLEKIGWAIWPLNFPVFSIVNPAFTTSVPKMHTIYGIVDIMSHLIEDYFHAKDINHPIISITDRHIETMLISMMALGKKLVNDLENIELRTSIAYIGTQALSTQDRHITEGDWACHAIEHAISAVYDIPHGGGLAIVIPHWMKFAVKKAPHKFVQFAANVMGLKQQPDLSDYEFGCLGITAFEAFLKTIEAPLKLSYYQIDDREMDQMVSKTFGSLQTIGKLVSLNHQDVKDILLSCL
jgi:alcohol dehydrogenase